MSPTRRRAEQPASSGVLLATALADLPARSRIHELAKRAGLTSKEILAGCAAAGITAGSASSALSAQDATTVLTALLAPAPIAEPEPEQAVDQPASADEAATPVRPKRAPRSRAKKATLPVAEADKGADEEGVAESAAADRPAARAPADQPGAFAAPLFLPPADAPAPQRRRRSAAAPDAIAVDADHPGTVGVESSGSGDGQDAGGDGTLTDAAAGDAAPRSGRRRRGRSGRGRGPDDAGQPAESELGRTAAAETGSGDIGSGDTDPGGTDPADTPADHSAVDRAVDHSAEAEAAESVVDEQKQTDEEDEDSDQSGRRRRRRGRRGRGRVVGEGPDDDESTGRADEPAGAGGAGESAEPGRDDDHPAAAAQSAGDESPGDQGDDQGEADDGEPGEEGGTRRRRRRRRRSAGDDSVGEDDPDNTVVHVREPRPPVGTGTSEVQGVRGSTRLEAKRQRRREGRDTQRRPQILTESEFLARRESVERVMAVRQRGGLAQVALLEDGVLVEHFVSRAGSESLMGNIYLGRVQNVLPSMEAAFVDIGKGRNAVLYAGEVNWDAAGLAGKARRIETALSGGDTVLVQVSKDPVGQKGARLTTQLSLPGRFLVYVPGSGATGISRKLPDTERKRLKNILDRIVPEDAGVIIRTAAEGVGEDELARDVERLKSQWAEISRQAAQKANAPLLLSAEPDTLIKVIRDLFNSDIARLVLDGDDAYGPVWAYVNAVAPELAPRVSRYDGPNDVFTAYRIDEQIAKALERKVFLPSGGSLVIDRTEAMTVIDVNTGKYTGSGGNLEETVTKNNLEAAEEVVRQLRLRDIGGIIVVDFIDMVLESNRELVMRRLTECLGRDRTRHQVAEVTSLGLIQMTRKKMGTGLVEAFSEPCPHCHGRGIMIHDAPVADKNAESAVRAGSTNGNDEPDRRTPRNRRTRNRSETVEEPEPVLRVAPAARPDPRGPKPPASMAGQPAVDGHVDDQVDAQVDAQVDVTVGAVLDDQADRPAAVDEASRTDAFTGDLPDADSPAGQRPTRRRTGSDNAPRSADASAAVSAVFAALDAKAERVSAAATAAARAAAESADHDGTADNDAGTPAQVESSTPIADQPAAGGRRRGRRAAGRPAGAPASNTPNGGAETAVETPLAAALAPAAVFPVAESLYPENSGVPDSPGAKYSAADQLSDPSSPPVVPDPAEMPNAKAPQRRRRAASRPAGPPPAGAAG